MLTCQPTPIAGLFVLHSQAHVDVRGSFRRSWCQASLRAAGIDFVPQQANLSENLHRYTLRGMHYQLPPFQEQKLVRCLHGSIFDVALDLRPGSPTWGQHWGLTLDAEKGEALFIPAGCAHGFLTLTESALVEYLIDMPYAPESARGVRWDDPRFALPWPAQPLIIAERDRVWPDYV